MTVNWRVPLYTAAGTLLCFLPFALSSADIGELAYVALAAPIVSLALLVRAIRRKGVTRLSALSMLVVYLITSLILVRNYSAVRDCARWLVWSRIYQAEVMAQPSTVDGGLKHVEWDAWGFGGEDTVVYLVFDPTDSLAAASRSRAPFKFSGIPCAVPLVRRLQSYWYAVMFYTDTSWGHCG